MDNNEWKCVGATLVHVVVWGVGLFCTTFFPSVSELSLAKIFEDDIAQMVIAPSVVVLAMFLWDEAGFVDRMNIPLKRMKQLLKWNFIIIGVTLISFALVILTKDLVQIACLLTAWVGITAIKFVSKFYGDLQIEINKVS